MTRALREAIVVATGFLAAAIVLTLPVARSATRALPSDTVDTLLNAWIVAWDSEALRHGLAGLWNAPIFHPAHTTLAFSENLLGLALFVAPAYWVTGNAVATYNVAFILSFALAGTGMYVLVRELTGRPLAAMAAGVFYAFCPFRMAQIAHIQMIATGWMPIGLWALHRYFATSKRRWLAVLVVAWILQTLSNLYVGYFMALPVLLVAAAELWQRHDRRRLVAELAVAAVALVIALAPVAAPYYRVRVDYHQVRDRAEIASLGADVRSYLVLKQSTGVWRRLPTATIVDPEKELFPGFVAVALALVALLGRGHEAVRRWARVYAVVGAAAFVLSLGPDVRVWGHRLTGHGPYEWLLRIAPGLDGMRVPARFASVVVAALAVMAGCAVASILARLSRRTGALVASIAMLAIVSEGWAVPLPTVPYDPRGRAEDRAAADWLPDDAAGAVLHLPLATADARELNCQYATLFDRHPIVNGFSGYAAPLQRLLAHPASPLRDFERFDGVVRMLRALGVRFVVVHAADYGAAPGLDRAESGRTIDALRASRQIVREAEVAGATAFELQNPIAGTSQSGAARVVDAAELKLTVSEAPDRLPFLVDGNRDTRWIAGMRGQDGSSRVGVELAAPMDIARVDLQIAERSMIDYPRHIRIEALERSGGSRVLYDATPYPELAAAILRDPQYPVLQLDVPSNQATNLTIRQTATTRAWWSIHELRIWRR